MIPHDLATLALFDRGSQNLLVQFLGTSETETPRGEVRVPLEGSPAEEAFRTREPVLVETIPKGSELEQTGEFLTRLAMHSACTVRYTRH